MRQERSYEGEMMKIGKENEDKIIDYLKSENIEVIDFRDSKEHQDIEVDILAGDKTIEIKADKYINTKGNLFFETQRIYRSYETHPQEEGWGYKSKADWLIVRNWLTGETFVFDFEELRKRVHKLVSNFTTNRLSYTVVETDKIKTTFGLLIPTRHLKDLYDYKVIN